MTKIKCLKCGDIIESNGRGKWVQCSCKKCYIDETEYYCRVGGDLNLIEVEIDGKWVLCEDSLAQPKKNLEKK